MLSKGVDFLKNSWKTTTLEIPKELESPFMRLVKLPYLKDFQTISNQEPEYAAYKLMRVIQDIYNVQCCVSFIQGHLYVRISCFVYNTIEDYISLANAINDIIIKSK